MSEPILLITPSLLFAKRSVLFGLFVLFFTVIFLFYILFLVLIHIYGFNYHPITWDLQPTCLPDSKTSTLMLGISSKIYKSNCILHRYKLNTSLFYSVLCLLIIGVKDRVIHPAIKILDLFLNSFSTLPAYIHHHTFDLTFTLFFYSSQTLSSIKPQVLQFFLNWFSLNP